MVERARLLIECACECTEGSNPFRSYLKIPFLFYCMIRFCCICVVKANFVEQNGAKKDIHTDCVVLVLYNKIEVSPRYAYLACLADASSTSLLASLREARGKKALYRLRRYLA